MTQASRTNGTLDRLAKRTLDVCFSLVALIVFAPVMLGVAALILATLGRPVLFRQMRAGKDGRPFRVWKFRTMTNDRGASGNFLPDQDRQTKLGTFLRDWSLDELPQFFNVLEGSMSLVGPRPLPLRYLPRYNERQRMRLAVKPGITGLAQVSGRRALDWQSRFEFDVLYVESASFWLDLRLVLGTVGMIFRRVGVERPEEIEFWGNGVQGPPGIRYFPTEEDETRSSYTAPPIARSP